MREKINISIIIVNYKVKNELFSCLASIYNSKSKSKFEIIVVDNDENKVIGSELKKKFPNVKYIESPGNIGYGAGNNLGAKEAKGEYLFILNPDTVFLNNIIDPLVSFIKKNKKTGISAPLLFDKNNEPYSLQGTKILTPKRAIFGLSFLAKLFPNNKIYRDYYFSGWNKKNIKEVDVVPGTAFAIEKRVFDEIGGFDEKFFLFFEEFDLCKRLRKKGYKTFIIPEARLFHEWGSSTAKKNDTQKIFKKSRFYYFKKNFGLTKAIFTEIILSVNKYSVILFLILLLGIFLRTYRLPELMTFIGDQGLFYLPARDMILHGNIPLVGPETSHPWIHHGALWIYLLGIVLWLSNFNPVVPAFFIAGLGVVTIFIFYSAIASMFGRNIALLSAMLYATSPLIVINSRIPYHTSPIPFFVILLFFLTYKWIKGNVWVFPIITFLLGVLYNHEITTFVYFITISLILMFGFIKKKIWFKKLINKKIITASLVSFLIPMAPFILYDTTHGYNQTLRFLIWVVYRIVKFPLSLVDPRFVSPGSSPSTLPDFLFNYQRLIFAPSSLIALIILFITGAFLITYLFRNIRIKKKPSLRFWGKIPIPYALLFLFSSISLIGLSIHRVPIEADTLLIAPFIIILSAISIMWIFRNKFNISFFIVLIILFINTYFLLSTSFVTNLPTGRTTIFTQKIEAMDKVLLLSNGQPYNIVGKGELSDFPSFTMPYEYLLWWKGHAPQSKSVPLKIVIWEKGDEVIIYKEK